MWFNLAAMAGSRRALNNRDIAAQNMTPAEVAEAQKLARESKTKQATASIGRCMFAPVTIAKVKQNGA